MSCVPTVMVMTLNEESNIREAIESFPPGTPIVVYDSFSSDRTVEIARRLGAEVVQRRFDNWAAHQNWGATNIQFPTPWVYYSDADERMTPELWEEILEAVNSDASHVAYACRRKDFFLGTWIRRSSFYPHWFVRLYRPGAVKWERLVNPVTLVNGSTGQLMSHFHHFPFSKGVAQWFERHVQYAAFEAEEVIRRRDAGGNFVDLLRAESRRAAVKRLFYKVPGRPLVKFLVLYIFRGGFLDGRADLYYASMQAAYELMISAQVLERDLRAQGVTNES